MIAGIVTLILLIAFLVGVALLFRPRHKAEFDAAARIPLEDQSENMP
ncbi:cbb3-type cytochrome oxidase subunit 3 [Arenimonas fontis]|uniref:Cbb3-type cytochrome c oxidase subunit 3 n=1 Tax=Arenimonas fontis TaxID=2608255 RepID=A0A5B2ZBC7_9GAMM|nr:cbb3-type cytochrome c oxidase subunit 3 [Arenimonas fontis]KAA2284843.1 cbb3-type cytochrome c oxidase subunit 3 [Arenimonas fontis]